MAIHKYDNSNTSSNGISVPQREALSVVRKGVIDYTGSSVTLNSTNIVYHYAAIVNLELPSALFTSPGTTAIVDKVNKLYPNNDPANVTVFSNMKPWNTGGLFFDDGTNKAYWRKATNLNSNYGGQLIVYYSIRCTNGTFVSPGPIGTFQYSIVNSNSVAGNASGFGGAGSTGKYYYWESQTFDRYGNITDYVAPVLVEYNNDSWRYEPNAFIGDAQ